MISSLLNPVTICWLLFIFPGSTLVTWVALFILHTIRNEKNNFFKGVDYRQYLYLWLLRPIFSIALGVAFYGVLSMITFPSITVTESYFANAALLYFCFEMSLFCFHSYTHKFVGLSFLHSKHHLIKNLHWTNSAEESWWFEVVVVLQYVFWLYFLNTPIAVYAIVIVIWKVMLAITHYSYPFSFGKLDAFFVSPKFHVTHHQKPNKAEGITVSFFDNLYEKIIKN